MTSLPPVLQLAGTARFDPETQPWGINIDVRGYDPGKATLGYGQYVTKEQLARMDAPAVAQMLSHLHRKLIHELASHLVKEGYVRGERRAA